MKKPIYSPYFFKKNLVFSVLIVVLCALILMMIFSFFVYDSNIKATQRAVDSANKSCYIQVDNVLDNATRICMFFASYKTVSPVFQSQQTSIDLKKATLMEEMRTFIACNDFLSCITVVTEEYTLARGLNHSAVFSEPRKYKSFDISYSLDHDWPSVLRIRFLSDKADFYSVSVDIYTSYLGDLYFDENSYCFAPDGTLVLGAEASILGSPIEDVLGLSLEEASAKAIPQHTKAVRPISDTGFLVISLQDNSSLLPQILLNVLSYFAICILVFAIVIPIIYLQLKRIYRPINKVMDVFKYYLPQDETFIEDDIKFISYCVCDPDMGPVTKAAVRQIRQSQLHTLQSQISPHFLGNSLDAINWKAVKALGVPNPLSEALSILSLFISNSYEYSSMFVTIKDEISRTEKYIQLAKYCSLPNLQVAWEVDPSILNYSIISLSLQPLIENSIEHGFVYPENEEQAAISISILPKDSDISITLRDNGCGMTPKVLHDIRATLESDGPPKHHIGLKNTHLKLRLLYGEKYGIAHIESSTDGTCIQLLIPKRTYPGMGQQPDPG